MTMCRSTILPLLLLAVSTLVAQDYTTFPAETTRDATSADTNNTNTLDLSAREDGSWIGIYGTVGMVGANSFFLDYGDSTVMVGLTGEVLREYDFIKGQKVTVYGKVDNDLFDKNIIKARAVVIEGGEDSEITVVGEEDKVKVITGSHVSTSVIHGLVTAVTEKRIVIEQGSEKLSIDTSELSFDVTDDQGRTQVKQGDLVTVQGVLRRDFWDNRMLLATAMDVIEMDQLQGREDGGSQVPASGGDRDMQD